MELPKRLQSILAAALAGQAPGRDDCLYLLRFPANSMPTTVLCAVADSISRSRFGNRAVLLGQIGIETAPCPGRCKFCAFGDGHTKFDNTELNTNQVLDLAHRFTAGNDLYALFLMTMHSFNFDRLIGAVSAVRSTIPAHTHLVVNIGDFTPAQARALRDAGADGAYHVWRLREGTDTALDPEVRKATIRIIIEAGLKWYYCCEPIGPEHTEIELVEQMFLGIDEGCFQHAAMRRVYLPNSPLAKYGQITERRLAQVVAVIALASLASPNTRSIAVHEPSLLGLAAGANSIYAEAGANPRDNEPETSQNRGSSVLACKRMLWEAGFSELLVGDNSTLPLAGPYA